MKNRIMPTLISAALALVSFQAQAQPYTERPGYWHYDWGWGHMIFGSLMMILFWGGIVAVVVLLIRSTRGGSTGGAGTPSLGKSPLDILNKRFARGEIDKEEFEERKKLLSG